MLLGGSRRGASVISAKKLEASLDPLAIQLRSPRCWQPHQKSLLYEMRIVCPAVHSSLVEVLAWWCDIAQYGQPTGSGGDGEGTPSTVHIELVAARDGEFVCAHRRRALDS